jgi:hypothetical protein
LFRLAFRVTSGEAPSQTADPANDLDTGRTVPCKISERLAESIVRLCPSRFSNGPFPFLKRKTLIREEAQNGYNKQKLITYIDIKGQVRYDKND